MIFIFLGGAALFVILLLIFAVIRGNRKGPDFADRHAIAGNPRGSVRATGGDD
jgi:hypothetical protein